MPSEAGFAISGSVSRPRANGAVRAADSARSVSVHQDAAESNRAGCRTAASAFTVCGDAPFRLVAPIQRLLLSGINIRRAGVTLAVMSYDRLCFIIQSLLQAACIFLVRGRISCRYVRATSKGCTYSFSDIDWRRSKLSFWWRMVGLPKLSQQVSCMTRSGTSGVSDFPEFFKKRLQCRYLASGRFFRFLNNLLRGIRLLRGGLSIIPTLLYRGSISEPFI
jgi:hypothetical protein